MEYSQTWNLRATPQGRPFWAHTASVLRTSVNDSTGWPAPLATDEKWRCSTQEAAMRRIKSGKQISLEVIAHTLSGWPTPNWHDGQRPDCDLKSTQGGNLNRDAHLAGRPTASARDWKDTAGMSETGVNPDGSTRSRLDQLPRVAQLAGWATPRAEDSESSGMRHGRGVADTLTAQAVHLAGWVTPTVGDSAGARNSTANRKTIPPTGVHAGNTLVDLADMVTGLTPYGSPAATASTAGFQLSPAFSLWLMGFPTSWHDAGVCALRFLREPETPLSPK